MTSRWESNSGHCECSCAMWWRTNHEAFTADYFCLLLNSLHLYISCPPSFPLKVKGDRKFVNVYWEPERYSVILWIKIVWAKEEKNREGGAIVGYSWHHYPGLSDRNCTDSRVCTLWLMERMSECDRTGDQPQDALSNDTFNSCLAWHSGILPVAGAREIEPSECVLLKGFPCKSTPVAWCPFWILNAWVVWKCNEQHVHSSNLFIFFFFFCSTKDGIPSSV